MIVCADHRGGDASILSPNAGGLEFPAPIAQTAIDRDLRSVGREIGAAVARDVLDVGFNLNLAPYGNFLERGDIEEFVFGNEMMGANPDDNASLSAGLVEGMDDAGLGTTYCVFPGGYGSLGHDPHHFAGTVDADEAELRERYLRPTRAALEVGVDAVMISHWQFPALDPESRPATYSPPVIEDLLRDELGYDGLIVTDAIWMAGAVEPAGSGSEAAIRALEAGADLILCAEWDHRIAVEEAVRDGRLSEDRIDEALERVLRLKDSLRSHRVPVRSAPRSDDRGAMADLVRRSLTWYRRPADWRPFAAESAEDVVAVAGWRTFLDAAGEVGGRAIDAVRVGAYDLDDEALDEYADLVRSRVDRNDRILMGTADEPDLALADRLSEDGFSVDVVHAGRVYEVERVDSVPSIFLSYSEQPVATRKAIEAMYGLADAEEAVPVPLDVDS